MEFPFSNSDQAPTKEGIESLLKILLKPLYSGKIDKVLPISSFSALI